MNYQIRCLSDNGTVNLADDKIVFCADKKAEEAFFTMEIDFPEWEQDCYIMMPACCYNGNRYGRRNIPYPPMYKKRRGGC